MSQLKLKFRNITLLFILLMLAFQYDRLIELGKPFFTWLIDALEPINQSNPIVRSLLAMSLILLFIVFILRFFFDFPNRKE